MDIILKTIDGLEPIVLQEVKSSKKILPGTIQAKVSNPEKLKKLRSITKVYILIKKFKFKDKKEILNQKLNLKKYLKNSFLVRCNREGKHSFKSIDLEKEFGAKILKNNKIKVDFKNPETIIYIDIINNDCLIGIDLTPTSLAKRDYKVKVTSQTLNSCIAYALTKFAKWKPSETLLDPFCKSGDIVIEAALSTNKKTKIYAIDNYTKPVEINSKLAKVKINIQKAGLDWLDTLFKKNSVDKIITSPPIITEFNKKEMDIIYKEFFNNSNYILKKTGAITIITTTPEQIREYAKEYKFKINKEYNINLGSMNYMVLILNKNGKR